MQVNREFSVEWECHTNYGQRPKWANDIPFSQASCAYCLKAGCPVREARPMAIHDRQVFGQAARKIRLTGLADQTPFKGSGFGLVDGMFRRWL